MPRERVEPPPALPPDSSARRWAILAQLLLLFCLTRVVFLMMPMTGEEGVFADLFVHRPAGPEMCLFGRVDGQKRYDLFLHPAACYEAIRAAGWLGSWTIPTPPVPDNVVTPRLRAAFSVFQLVAWAIVLICLLWRAERGRDGALWVLLAAVIASPLAMLTSAQLQVDGGVGVLMNAVMAAAILQVVRDRPVGVAGRAVLFGAAFILGLGKQEWTLCLLAALAVWAAWFALLRNRPGARPGVTAWPAAAILAGLAAGHAASCAYDPRNYIGGWRFLAEVFARATPVHAGYLRTWLTYLSVQGPMFPVILGVLAAIVGLVAARRAALGPPEVLLLLYGLALTGAFVFQAWYPEPRYLAPGLLVLSAACAAMFPPRLGLTGRVLVGLLVAALAIHSVVFVKQRVEAFCPVRMLNPRQVEFIRDASAKGYLVRLEHALAWNKPGIDYMAESMNAVDTEHFLGRYDRKEWEPPRRRQ